MSTLLTPEPVAAPVFPTTAKTLNRGAAFAALALIGCLFVGGVGYVGWQAFQRFGPRGDVVYVDVPVESRGIGAMMGQGGRRGFGGRNANPTPAAPANFVRAESALRYTAQTGDSVLEVSRANVTADWRYGFRYTNDAISTGDREALVIRRRVTSDPAVATAIGATADQVAELGKLAPGTGMIVDKADIETMKPLFTRYIAAAAGSAEQTTVASEILAALKTTGDTSRARTTRSAADRAAKVRSILSAEQINKFSAMR